MRAARTLVLAKAAALTGSLLAGGTSRRSSRCSATSRSRRVASARSPRGRGPVLGGAGRRRAGRRDVLPDPARGHRPGRSAPAGSPGRPRGGGETEPT
ncbi:hypothetical protein NKG05_18205 [Oerskovia sp. M15]